MLQSIKYTSPLNVASHNVHYTAHIAYTFMLDFVHKQLSLVMTLAKSAHKLKENCYFLILLPQHYLLLIKRYVRCRCVNSSEETKPLYSLPLRVTIQSTLLFPVHAWYFLIGRFTTSTMFIVLDQLKLVTFLKFISDVKIVKLRKQYCNILKINKICE